MSKIQFQLTGSYICQPTYTSINIYKFIFYYGMKILMDRRKYNMSDLRNFIANHEDWLMDRILKYAKERGYVKYTATLKEAWRLSISGISEALFSAIQTDPPYLELGPDEDFTADPAASFGMTEAKLHRKRGVSLSMFLGLMKYYRQSYKDLLNEAYFESACISIYSNLIERFFDRMEIAFCVEWAGSDQDKLIQELQEKNRAMTNEKNLYLTVFESHPYLVFVLDKIGNIINMNHVAASKFESQTTPGACYYNEFLGNNRSWPDIVCDNTGSCYYLEKVSINTLFPWLTHDLDNFVKSKDINQNFERQVTGSINTNYFNVSLSQILDISEKNSGTLLVLKDVTEKKNLEESLINKTKNLEEAYTRIQDTQALIIQQEKLASIGQLAAGIAHEINNPMSFINGNLGILSIYMEDISDLLSIYKKLITALQNININDIKPLYQYTTQIHDIELKADINFVLQDIPNLIKESRKGIERIIKIIKDLKEFACPGTQKLSYTDINLNIDSTLNIISNELKDKANVKKIYGKLPIIKCYPQELNQVFMNLLINAAQSIIKDGTIIIRTIADNDFVEIKIKDNGIGIPEEYLSRIFEPFFTTKEVGKGSGLGLNVAYNIIQKHNGTITVKSKIGKGTSFTIRIPV